MDLLCSTLPLITHVLRAAKSATELDRCGLQDLPLNKWFVNQLYYWFRPNDSRKVKDALVQPSALVTCTVMMVVVTRLKPAVAVSNVLVVTPVLALFH